MNFDPMFAEGLIGGWEIVMIVMVTLFCVFVVPVAGTVAIVYLFARRGKTKPQPAPGMAAPIVPVPGAPAAAAPVAPTPPSTPAAAAAASPGVITHTILMSRQCPQCGAALQPDSPEGLCPACLLQRGFPTETGSPPTQPSFVPPPIDELAKLFPQLEILECLGRGGMGAVYKARQPRLDRFVALKILAPEKQNDPQFAERFEREARVLARLSHPNIVSIFDFGEVQGRFYLLMEFVDGLTLRQVMQAGKISSAQALDLVPKICEALQYAHGQGIVHRDIKPENILMDKQGNVKIADFGIAKIAGMEATGLSLTGARDVMGTPVYMAPEQVEKPQTVDHRADIYSLGVVFYEMLTGELPLGKFSPPSQRVRVDVRLDEVVLHALEKEPSRRYQQASQVKTAVETIAGSPAPFATAPAPSGALSSNGIITAPAVALMVAGLWKIFGGILSTLALSGLNGWLGGLVGMGTIFGGLGAVAVFSVVLFKIIPGCLILFGGFQMLHRRSYAWAMAAGILAVVACSLIGLPVGIWALLVLAREEVKSAFGVSDATPMVPGRPDRFWRRFTVVVACVILIPATLLVIALASAAMAVPNFFKASASARTLTPDELKTAGIYQEGAEYHKDSSQSYPLDANGRFNIDSVNGQIEIHGWDSNVVAFTAAIHGKSGDGVNQVKIKVDSDTNHVNVHTESTGTKDFQWSWSWFKSLLGDHATVDYTVHVPKHAKLEDVSSVNGHIKIDGVAGDIKASTVNGETLVNHASGNLMLDTVNGRIKADMDLLGSGQSVSLDAVNGELELGLPENADATFSVSTVNGNITSDFPALQPKKEFPVGNKLNGSLGHGNATVKAEAVNGTIKFEKHSVLAENPIPAQVPPPPALPKTP